LALARVKQRRGDPAAAQAHLRAELDLPGHSPAQALELARLLIDLRMPRPAIALLTPVIESASELGIEDGQLATALLHRGVARMLTRDMSDGIADCRRALRLAPRNVVAMQNLVLAYIEERQFRRARYWLRLAMVLRPSDEHLRLLRYHLFGGRVLDALRRIRRGLLFSRLS
jgi:hypothetical protein